MKGREFFEERGRHNEMVFAYIGLALLFFWGCYCIRKGVHPENRKRRVRSGEEDCAARIQNTTLLTGRFREIGTSFQVLGEILAKEPQELRQDKEADF